jgi:hypothetical protein
MMFPLSLDVGSVARRTLEATHNAELSMHGDTSRGAKLFGRCERNTGLAAFDRLVAQIIGREPYRLARCVSSQTRLFPSRSACCSSTATSLTATVRPDP